MGYNKSKIDDLFNDIMGYYPSKEGTAYEIISAAVLGLVLKQDAQHNRYIAGTSGSKYQLDGLINQNIMLEAKDYSKRCERVGRDDLQKMEGALVDLEQIEKGIFTSATQYTSEASKYADGTKRNAMMKEIIPVELRPSTTDDEKHRINTIVCHVEMAYPDYDSGEFEIVYADGEQERLVGNLRRNNLNGINAHVEQFYDKSGNIINTLSDISLSHKPKIENGIDEIEGQFDINANIKIASNLYEIKGLKYSKVPVRRLKHSFTITSDGSPRLLIKSDGLNIDKLITEKELRQSIVNIVQNGSEITPKV